MTYDRQISTTFEQFVTDLYTKISGMTGYGILNDSSTSGHVAISTPTPAIIIIESDQLGSGADASRDLYITEVEGYTDPNTYEPWADSDRSYFEFNGVSATDSVQYWLQYTADYGFVWYLRRDVGDGDDLSAWSGMMEYANGPGTQFWDPRNADSVTYTISPYAVSGDFSNSGNMSAQDTGFSQGSDHAQINRSSLNGDFFGNMRGLLNPDSAFNNYVWWSNLAFRQRQVQDADTGQNPVWAAIDDPLWMKDQSGTDVNTGDVVQDSGGVDEWEILDYHGLRVALRMI